MSAILWLALLGAIALERPQAEWQRLLEEGRFGAAWQVLSREPDPLDRARGEVEVLYRAGDPAGALARSESGLDEAPEDLELLHRAVSASIWLRDGARAREWLRHLERAISTADPSGEDRSGWQEAARDFGARIGELERSQSDRWRAVARARLVTGSVFLLSVGALVFLLRALRADREARSGTADR